MSDYPRTLLEFEQLFPDETACARHLERIRWPEGFECPFCGHLGVRGAFGPVPACSTNPEEGRGDLC
jgi:transposase-like zinc ribbon protein